MPCFSIPWFVRGDFERNKFILDSESVASYGYVTDYVWRIMATEGKKTTIKDIAREAGVSTATVSRILNNLEGYTGETRKRVMDVIERRQYRPSAIARGLVSQQTKTIGVLLPSLSSRFMNTLIEGIESQAQAHGYSVILCNTDRDGVRTADYLKVLGEKRVDGIIFTSEWVTSEYALALKKLDVPVVLVATNSWQYSFPSIRTEDKAAAYSAVRYLIEKGHRRIGMVGGTHSDKIAGIPREEGYFEALEESGIPRDTTMVSHGDFHFASGIRAMQELYERHPEITAVFAASDEMALGVLSFAYAHGIRVPEQLSVIGYDDTLDAQMSIPPLTSIHQPIYEMGAEAVMTLLESQDAMGKVLPISITERDSVCALRGSE
ncbi:MAG: LacI family transcriptional regulator [Spirochaetales bacterium]|nr:LacI family transcriptional regulator [Spirochaetales bacterium]